MHASAVAHEVERLAAAGTRTAAVVAREPEQPDGQLRRRRGARRAPRPRLGARLRRDLGRGLRRLSLHATAPATSPSRPRRTSALVFSLAGLSKSAALPQLKLGWILANGAAAHARGRAAPARVGGGRHPLRRDARAARSPPPPRRQPPCRGGDLGARSAERARAADGLSDGRGGHGRARRGGLGRVPEGPRRPAEEEIVLDLLETHDVLVHPGYFYEFPSEAWLVVSLLPPPDVFVEGVTQGIAHAR